MSTVDELHTKAVDLAEEAFLLKKAGHIESAKALFAEALEYEEKAAFILPPQKDSEPSRSIIFRSAASLALNSGDFEKADWLVANGLAGFPPIEISEELKILYEEINFQRHLSAKGIVLSDKNWLMTIYGNATSYGKASAEILFSRVEKLTALYYRTVERLLKLPYRTNGSIRKELKEKYGLYVDALAPSSFGIAFHVGKPDNQLEFEFPDAGVRELISPEDVVDEVMACFQMLEMNQPEELKKQIPDETYYENFVGLTKLLAPDGDKIKMVGFSVSRNGENKPIALKKNQQQIRDDFGQKEQSDQSGEAHIKKEFTGILMHAHSPIGRKHGLVKLYTQDEEKPTQIQIQVPIALMKDVVQPFYEEKVRVQVTERQDKFYLDEIEPLE